MPKITSRFPKRFNTPRGQRRLKCNVPTNYQCGGKCQPIKNKCNKEALGMAKDGLAYLKAVEERKARIAAVNAKRGGRTQYAVDDLGNVSRGTEGRAADPGKRFYKGNTDNQAGVKASNGNSKILGLSEEKIRQIGKKAKGQKDLDPGLVKELNSIRDEIGKVEWKKEAEIVRNARRIDYALHENEWGLVKQGGSEVTGAKSFNINGFNAFGEQSKSRAIQRQKEYDAISKGKTPDSVVPLDMAFDAFNNARLRYDKSLDFNRGEKNKNVRYWKRIMDQAEANYDRARKIYEEGNPDRPYELLAHYRDDKDQTWIDQTIEDNGADWLLSVAQGYLFDKSDPTKEPAKPLSSTQSGIDGNTKGVDKAQTGDRQSTADTKARAKFSPPNVANVVTYLGKSERPHPVGDDGDTIGKEYRIREITKDDYDKLWESLKPDDRYLLESRKIETLSGKQSSENWQVIGSGKTQFRAMERAAKDDDFRNMETTSIDVEAAIANADRKKDASNQAEKERQRKVDLDSARKKLKGHQDFLLMIQDKQKKEPSVALSDNGKKQLKRVTDSIEEFLHDYPELSSEFEGIKELTKTRKSPANPSTQEKQWVTYLQNDGTKSRKKLTGEQIERIKTKWGKTDDDIAQGRITLRQIKSVTSASTMKPSTKATKPVAEKTSRPIDSIDTENPDLKAAVARATYGKAYGSPVSGDRFQRVLIDGQTYDVPESDFDVKQDAKAIAASQHLSRINAGEISAPSPAKPKAANPKPTRQTKATTGNDAAINVKPPMESDKSGYDFDALGNAHRHFITNTRHVGQSYKEGFESFMAELESKLKESTPADRQGEIPDVLNASKQKYFRLLDSIKSTAEGAYSVMMAGGSKFNSKQAARRGSSYDRSLSNFTSGLRSIESDALRKTGAQDVIDAKESAKIIKKQQSEKEAKQILKEIQAKFKKTPIVNDPTYKSPKPITKAQWAKIPSDYKSVMIDPETGVRYRADMTRPVYITDQKDTPLSKAEEAIAKLFAELEESGYRNPAKFIPTNFSEPRSPLTSIEKVKRARELRAKPQIRYTFVR